MDINRMSMEELKAEMAIMADINLNYKEQLYFDQLCLRYANLNANMLFNRDMDKLFPERHMNRSY